MSVLREDQQALWLILSKADNLEAAFKFHLTSLTLSITESDSTSRKGDKARFKNFLIKDTSASVTSYRLVCAKSMYERLAIIRTLKLQQTFATSFDTLDCYKAYSIK